jgi:GH25 family lysozyme M1 (1,4-beta-N-acetylmuramidase)
MPFAMLYVEFGQVSLDFNSVLCYSYSEIFYLSNKEAAMPFVKGIDVSVYDPLVNWAKVRQQGYRFAYIRSSYGVSNNQTMMDTMFPSHWAGTKAAGVLRGAYHYLRASQDGAKQAKEYLKIVNPQPGDLPAALDLEEAFNQDATNAQFIKNAEAFLLPERESVPAKRQSALLGKAVSVVGCPLDICVW